MNELPPRIFGRTNEPVSPVWRERADGSGAIDAGEWLVAPITLAELDARRPQELLEARLATLGRRRGDLLLLTDALSSELKIGWPMHRMQQLRDRGLCRFFAIETDDPLEAEWITANAPVHGVVVRYSPTDMAVRYRVFEASKNAGVALIARATRLDEAMLHVGTPELCATIVDAAHSGVIAATPPEEVERLWTAFRTSHPEPAKLRSGHPPDYGV